MRLPRPFRRSATPKPPRTLRRRFVTPEGVDLGLELGSAGARLGAFLLDELLIVMALVALNVALHFLAVSGRGDVERIIWLLGFFVLRNGWFILFEMGSRAATPGKRVLGLRVVARDGGRLTGGAIVARNAGREVEVFLPITVLIVRANEGLSDGWLATAAFAWTGILLLFPMFNRDRLRVGDLIAGTWVVCNPPVKLAADLGTVDRRRRVFSEAALDLYGIYELQTLEEVLRNDEAEAIATVAGTIRRKGNIPDDPDDRGFLEDYYAALAARLERGLLVGRRRVDKNDRAARREAVRLR